MVLKAQGLNPFSPKWLGVLYSDSLNNNDLSIIQYNTQGVSLDIHIGDYYIVNSSYAATDGSFLINQGGNDISTVLTAYDSSAYIVGSYKRKFQTGDINRDIIVSSGTNNFCFIYGNSLAFSSFVQAEKNCFSFSL